MPRGGARVGAGRPKTSLTDVVESRSFDWTSRVHRKALLNDDLLLPDDYPRRGQLLRIQEAYRRCGGGRPNGVDIAKWFSSVVLND